MTTVAILLFGEVAGPVAGASGAIYGLFAAALVLSRVVGFDTRSLMIWIGLNFIITFSVPGISKLGHIGGFVIGGLATLALLGWTLERRPLRDRTVSMQAAGLAGLLVLLLAASVWRINDLAHYVLA